MNARARFLTHSLMFVLLPIMLIFAVVSMLDFKKAQGVFTRQIKDELMLLAEAQVREFVNTSSVMFSVVADMAEGSQNQQLLYVIKGYERPVHANPPARAVQLFPAVHARLERLVRNFAYLSAASLVDTRGNVILSTVSSFTGSNVADRAYFQQAMQGRESSENLESRATGSLVSVFAKPVYFNKEIVGVAYAVLDLDKLGRSTVDTINFHHNGNAYVFSNTGQLMMHPNSDYKGINYSALPWVRQALSNSQGIIDYSWFENEKIGAYMRVPGVNWTVVIAGAKEDIFGPIYTSFHKGFIVACMMIVMLVITFVLLQKVKELMIRRQEAFNELEKESLLLQNLFEECPILMCIYNDYTEIVVCNPALTELTGFTVFDDITGMFDPNDAPLLTKIFEDGEAVRDRDLTVYDVSGRAIYLRLQLSLIEYKGKLAVLAWGQDITNLTMAVQQAQEYLLAKNNFMSCMSHEIRTPMNAVLGMLYLVLQTRLSYEQEQYMLKIQGAATNLLGIINEILDFSKIEAGKMTLEVADFYLSDVIRHLSDLFSFAAEQKQIILFFFLSPHIPNALRGDKLRLTQVLTNLIGNAIKFTQVGKIVVYVHLVSLSKGQVSINFIVRDTGVGMSEDQIQRIYEPFIQADETISRKYGGTGLGLTITKSLLDLMGGSISVESMLGAGTTFKFTLAFDLAQNNFESSPALGALKILVVDDNSTDREFLGTMLAKHTVHMAQNGESAIKDVEKEALRGAPYDIVFLDWVMPQMSGYSFMVNLQRCMVGQKMPIIIVISAHEVNDLVEQMIKLNISLFLPKPISAFAVQNSIVYALNSARTATLTAHLGESLKLSKHFAGAKLLLVEDTPANIEVASKILSNMGCQVTVAVNGLEAVKMVQQDDFALVLMDIHMPVLDGLKATKMIRNLPDKKYEELPIIAMTALALDEEKEACYAAGMNAHMAKPFVPKELLALLEKYLKVETVRTQNAAPVTDLFESEESVEVLPPMDGFDTAMGLLYLAGNIDMYLDQLRMFPKQYGDYAQKIERALGEGDSENAKKLAHTLKGVSKMFGAVQVSDASKDVEMALRAESVAKAQEALHSLSKELQRVVSTLSAFPFERYGSKDQGPLKSVDFEQEKMILVEKITLIATAVEDDLGAVLTIVEELDKVLVSQTAIQSLAPVKNAIAQCDIALIKDEVRHLLEKLSS